MANNINVEVAYATAEKQMVLNLSVPVNTSIREAIIQSKLFAESIDQLTVGIFGRLRSMDYILQEGDRIEIYRPLFIDPKDARIQRVKRDRRAKKTKNTIKCTDDLYGRTRN